MSFWQTFLLIMVMLIVGCLLGYLIGYAVGANATAAKFKAFMDTVAKAANRGKNSSSSEEGRR